MSGEKSGMQGIFGLLMVIGGLVLVAVVMNDLGGFFGPGSTTSGSFYSGGTKQQNNYVANNLGEAVFAPAICQQWPTYPLCPGQGLDPATQCTMRGSFWDGTKCIPPHIAPGK